MKNILFSTQNKNTTDWAALILRVGFGALMIPMHGWAKFINFEVLQHEFINFMGLGSTISLSLVIFAELFCSVLLILGLFTRLASIPLIITALVIQNEHNWEFFGKYELGTAFLFAYIAILLLGPGKFSLDAVLKK